MKYEVPIYYECLSTVMIEADSKEDAYEKIIDNIQCLKEDCADIQKIFASQEYREDSMVIDGSVNSIIEVE